MRVCVPWRARADWSVERLLSESCPGHVMKGTENPALPGTWLLLPEAPRLLASAGEPGIEGFLAALLAMLVAGCPLASDWELQ